MDVDAMIQGACDALTVKRVFGEPVERDGVTVIPVAWLVGGAGGGSGEDAKGNDGGGGGFGLIARPAGVYEISQGRTRWVPAVDPARLLLAAGVMAVGLFAVVGRAVCDARQTRTARAGRLVAEALAGARRAGGAR